MIQFPSTTAVGRVMPKEAFYKRLMLNNDLKEKFVTDVKRITLSNSLTTATLNLEAGKEVSEILILTVELKKRQFDGHIVEIIARQNNHKLVFLVRYENEAQLAVYYGKLYTTAWLPCEEITLTAKGFTLDVVWQGFIEQIALQDGVTNDIHGENIDTKLQRQEQLSKLKKEVERLQKSIQNEVQPTKKFAMYQQLTRLKLKLNQICKGV